MNWKKKLLLGYTVVDVVVDLAQFNETFERAVLKSNNGEALRKLKYPCLVFGVVFSALTGYLVVTS